MSKYKVCVYAICKNEEQFVDRWMDAVGEADEVIVTDTGSTDGTVEKLRGRGAVVYTAAVNPWRFDVARNIALDHIPEDADICVSNDLDEVFETGWRHKLEDAWTPDTTRAGYLFTVSFKGDGSPEKQHRMEKIHCRGGFRWVRPVHEVLEYSGELQDKSVWVDGLVLNHYPDYSKPRSQYLPLLELSAKENPEDDQTAFWLGREYLYDGQYDRAAGTLQNHLKMPSAVWDEERCASMRLIAKCKQLQGDLTEARKWLFRSIAECPHVREPYYDLAMLGYLETAWELVLFCVSEGLKITQQSGSYLTEPSCWGEVLYDLGAICCYHLGLYDQAALYAKTACELSPNDTRLQGNLQLIREKTTIPEKT